MEPIAPSEPTSVFRGALLTVGMRVADRLFGVISTVVLARLLLPQDFGLVAMALVVSGFVEVIMDLGVHRVLIQNPEADVEDFNTAWTLRLAQAGVAFLLLITAAPFAADYYDDSRVAPILRVVAATVLVGAFENIGAVSFQRNMEFGRDFRFEFLKRSARFVITISAALILRSYWALVLGALLSRIAGVGLSYRLSAFRPRFSLSRLSRIWSFSQWNLLAGIGGYIHSSLGRFVIGGRFSAGVLGAYSIGHEIASLPTSELLAPLGRVLFPAFASIQNDRRELLRLGRLAMSIQVFVALPACVGLALVAGEAIPMLLGSNWRTAVPFVQIFALGGMVLALGHAYGYLLLALGEIKWICVNQWIRATTLAGAVLVVFPSLDARGIALAQVATAFIGLISLHAILRHLIPTFRLSGTVGDVWRPALSSLIMAGIVQLASGALGFASPLLRLTLEVGAGVCAYGISIWGLWRLAGRPPGAESYLLDRFRLLWMRAATASSHEP